MLNNLRHIAFCREKEGDELMMEEMNEVNDFMAKFGNDFEIKWGLAVDPTLGKKVKITILATGFGLENIPGMDVMMQKRTDDAEKLAEEQEKEEERRKRREGYYKPDGTEKPRKRRHHVFYFSTDDIDNDDIISMVE